jgi:SNF family Na+-dependent transporter
VGEPLACAGAACIGSIFAVSLLATVAIFPLVFHYGLDPAGGPQLVFEVLPVAFAEMPGGRVIGTLFFALLILAAFTPSVGLLEPWTAWLVERAGMRRPAAVCLCTGSCWLLGQGSVLSFGRWSQWHPLAAVPRLATLNLFGLLDCLIPEAEFSGLPATSRRLLLFALRYVCPLGILIVVIVGFVE